jgi:Neuraminidase (sialidase)
MRKINFIFVAMFLAVILLPLSVRATVSPNVNLSKLTGYQGEATIAIDPTNPNRMFASSNVSTTGLFAAYSTDGGTTWQYPSPDKIIADGADSLPAACCDPIAVFDKFGNLYLAYLTNSPVNAVVAFSTNGGQSFGSTTLTQKEQVLGMFPYETSDEIVPNKRYLKDEKDFEGESPGALNAPGDQPTVATGPSFFAGEASVYVSWANSGIKVAGTRASGLGVITPFSTVQTTLLVGNYGDIEVGPNGQVLVTAQAATGGQGPTNINVILDADGLGPAAFAQPVFVTTNKKETSFFKFENFGSSILATSTNVGGFDFIPAQANRSIDAEADLSWDKSGGTRNGRVYLAYTEETVNENNDTNIMLRYSDNNGATWTAPLKVNDDTTARSQFFPKIEVDQTTGHIAVAFYDCRNDASGTDAAANTEAEVFGAVSFNGGVSFAANELISQSSSRSASFANANDYGDYNGLAFHNNKYFYIWADNSNITGDNANGTRSSPDLYTAKVTILTPTAASATVGGRVYTPSGRGLANAVVIMTNQNGESVQTRTNQFGYYRFTEVQSGETYIFNVVSKRYQFATQVVTVEEDLDGLNFFAQ